MSVPKAGALAKASDWTAAFQTDDDAWATYTPTLTQSATVTKTVTAASYMKIGRLVVVRLFLLVTGTGTASNAVEVGLPVAAAALDMPIGTGFIFDSSVPLMRIGVATVTTTSTSTFGFFLEGNAGVRAGVGVFTAALASNDQVRAQLCYESAS